MRKTAMLGALLAVGALVALAALRQTPPEGPPPGSHGVPIPSARTVLVAAGGLAKISVPGQALHTKRLEGAIPASATPATVLTDENCTPDASGVSHCTNRLRMDDGSELTVVHSHRMGDVPCLSPGERVRVEPV